MTNNSERRSTRRIPIQLEAQLLLDNGVGCQCIISDFCFKGMFVKFKSEETHVIESYMVTHPNNHVSISFTIGKRQNKTDVHQISAEIVHLIDSAIGIRFTKEHKTEIQALLSIQVSDTKTDITAAAIKETMSECTRKIQRYTSAILAEIYPNIVEEIKAASVKSSSDQTANAMMASASRMEAKSKEFQALFLTSLQDPVGSYNQSITSGSGMNERLSLIDKGEFEDWLTSRVITTRAETNYRTDLLPLKMRLNSIGVGSKQQVQCVFGPVLIVEAYHTAIIPQRLTSQAEKIAFKVFDKQLMTELADLYQALNDIMIEHGILPQLKLGPVVKGKGRASPPKRSGTQPDKNESEKTSNSVGSASASSTENKSVHSESLFTSLPPFADVNKAADDDPSSNNGLVQNDIDTTQRNVLGLMRTFNRGGESREQNGLDVVGSKYSETELIAGLAELQTASVESEGGDKTSLLERVLDNLKQDGSDTKGIDENQKVAIDVVDRFFLSMQKNPRISVEAKQHLLKLEVPVLKVLLKDENFFDDQASSVRAVMNRIAQLGAKGSRLNPASRKRINTLVHQIVEEFEQDTKVFDHVLAELDLIIGRQNQLYVKNVERVAAAADGVHRVEEAKVAVAREMNKRFENKQVPTAVLTLIEHGWKDLLNLIFIQQGGDSEAWHSHLEIIDNLIAYGDNPNIPLDIKSILPKIQDGLKSISGNGAHLKEVREQLKDLIQKAPQGQHSVKEAELQEVPETEEDIIRHNLSKSQELKTWIMKAKLFLPGTWLQHKKAKQEAQYIRLVWVAKGFSKFVFVNHQGMKVVELGLFKLATYLKEGRIIEEFDYEVPMVNQGLDDMVKDVYEKLSYESSHDEGSGLIKKPEFCRQVKVMMKAGQKSSLCSLIYVSFRGNDNKVVKLDIGFSKRVASILKELNGKQSEVGRVNDSDFVLFTLEAGLDMLKVRCQESLIMLCGDAKYESLGLEALVEENQAHLGFKNPELMIKTAHQALFKTISSEVSEEPESGDTENIVEISSQENNDASLDVDEAANSTPDAVCFEDLSFEIYVQRTKPVEEELHSEHVNLICSINGSGLIYEPENEEHALALDHWWLQQLVQKFQNQDPFMDGMEFVRVKLSGYAFDNDDFKSTLLDLCNSGDLDPQLICFDIYDCSYMDNVHSSSDRMRQLVSKGFRFSLDHFGSSRSPFSFLKVLPVKMISIDESFMEKLNESGSESDEDEVAASSIAEVAHYLGKKVLATSVDTAICLQRMTRLGVDFVQGSTISEPVKLS